ncbi:MAG TPA: HD domain-containing protein [Candidatus Faecivicinus avistercoris]|nr:HD domain-containing protein [Candidatus Faecivicinus avistercoris]
MKKQPQLAEMIKGQVFDGFLLTRTATQRTSSNGSKFLDMTLCDISSEVNAKMWDSYTPAPNVADVLRVRGAMTEYNGRPQLRVDKMRVATTDDDYDMSALAPCAPQPASEMLDYILNRVDAFKDPELKALVLTRLEECGDKLNYYPAASKLHHAERSGLLHHVSTMLRMAGYVCEVYPTLDADLLAAGVILHDLCKITEMAADEIGMVSDYTAEGMLVGHLVQGVAELARCGRELGVRAETMLLLEHMILSHHDLPEFGSPKKPMFPEAEVLHVLDLLDARMFEMNRALANIQPGKFTERIWSLDRKLYKRKS